EPPPAAAIAPPASRALSALPAGEPGSGALKLLADSIRLLVLELERPLPVVDGGVDVAEPQIEVAHVLFDRGIRRLAPIGLAQGPLRVLDSAQPEVGPAERVQIRGVSRLPTDRLLQQVARAIELHTLVRPH